MCDLIGAVVAAVVGGVVGSAAGYFGSGVSADRYLRRKWSMSRAEYRAAKKRLRSGTK